MKTEKEISVLMPVYNGGEYLFESVQSILNQTFSHFELIIINDGSTDNSFTIINGIANNDSRVVVIQQKNMGIVAALNNGLAHAQGKYIVRMDSDDIAEPNRFQIQYDFMEKNPRVVAAGSYCRFFGDQSRLFKRPIAHKHCEAMLLLMNCLVHPSVILRTSVLRQNNLVYREAYKYAEDYKLFSELSTFGEVTNIPQVLLKYRTHSNQTTVQKKKIQEDVHIQIACENIAYKGVNIDKSLLASFIWPNENINAFLYLKKCISVISLLLRCNIKSRRFLTTELFKISAKNMFNKLGMQRSFWG